MRKKIVIFLVLIIFCGTFIMIMVNKNNIALTQAVFSKEPLSNSLKEEMIKTNVWNKECPVDVSKLSLLKISYIDFAGNTKHDGKMVVLNTLADNVLEIFRELHRVKFPIAKIRLLNEYNGSDIESMKDNNTSSFNCRKVTNNNSWSMHAYGAAIDINPMQNPYVDSEYNTGKTNVDVMPPEGIHYLNRLNIRPGMVEQVVYQESKKSVIDLFNRHGFSIWGGIWNYPIDWHHFQIPKENLPHYLAE
jgi:hypothetical protein